MPLLVLLDDYAAPPTWSPVGSMLQLSHLEMRNDKGLFMRSVRTTLENISIGNPITFRRDYARIP